MEKSLTEDESVDDMNGMQQKAGELDRYARAQLMHENILEAFAMFEKSRPSLAKTFSITSSFSASIRLNSEHILM